MSTRQEQMEAFGRFLDVLDELREKCPWDRKQTNESLRPNTIEEVYELCDALINEDETNICKELGDVLLHVAFYAKIASEKGQFDMKDVCDRLCDKLIFRHPHVFPPKEESVKMKDESCRPDGNNSPLSSVNLQLEKVTTATQVSENWEQLKLKEKGGNKRVLSGVPSGLPSIVKAYRIQEKARNVGFEWDDASGAWDKLLEEIDELKVELERENHDLAEAELGDLLFATINVARMNGLSPDNALERTNQKFIRRFNYVEENAIAQGRNLKEMTLEEMDALWDEAKRKEREGE
ncbi:MAG: nucleoside triphosphate pyrophosphohydrolase [Bacteroidaceae bacterium]|nr:nucleoside triphosphate pyrophosphohydrolase [Bacteroidaceae bacterium]